MINMILQSKTYRLEDLRKKDDGQEPILGIPVLYQLIIAAAFQNGKPFPRQGDDLGSATRPGP